MCGSGYGQDHGRTEDGDHPPRPRLYQGAAGTRGHPRRPGRPVHRTYRAQDKGGDRPCCRWGALHDEAYYLFRPENERDYGQEVIEILLTEMENERGDLVVIFAGYPDRMATFFSTNPGLSSRVPHHIAFEDYDHEELMRIADFMVESEGFRFADTAWEAFSEYLTRRMKQPRFSNARSVRNAIERCRLRQARRLVSLDRPLGNDDLVTLTAEDVYGSSGFAEGPKN